MRRQVVINLGLMVGGLIVGLLVIIALRPLLPYPEQGGQRFVFTDYHGDTFYHQPGAVRPPAQNRILEDVVLFRDEDGFRRPRIIAEHYPLIALGDSFTDGGQVPWVDYLAEALDTPVRNLGWRGFGPVEYARVLQEYGDGDYEWVLVAFFEGNDLSNIRTAFQNGPAERDLVQAAGRAVDLNASAQEFGIMINADDWYLYPLQHLIPGREPFELAYISDYLWWLNGDLETYRQSRNLAELRATLETIKTAAGQACVGVVYIPSKEHIYFQYADPNGNRRYVLENGLALHLDDDGWLSFGRLEFVDYEVLNTRLENQQVAVREVTEALDLVFIDLLATFQEAARSSPPTYYPYDSHWNDNGHRLAGETVAEVVSQGCPSRF